MALIKPVPKDADLALSKARMRLLIKPDAAFFATLCLNSPVHWVTADEVPTAATDGINLFINPDFFMKLDADERIFIVLHEIMHNVYDHGNRLNFRDKELWNQAGDYVINDDLVQRGYKMPKGGLHDIGYRNMSADDIYDILVDKKDKGAPQQQTPWPDIMQPPTGGNGGQPDPTGNGNQGIGGMPQPTAQEVKQHNEDLLVSAQQQAKMAGNSAGSVPGGLQRHMDELLKPKLPWTRILSRFMFSLAKNDYSWRRPNKRYISQGIYLPSLHSEGVGRIDFAIDTSGSVSERDFNRFISEIGYVFRTFKPTEIGIMQFDSILQSKDSVCSYQDFMKLKFKGGGGTVIAPVLEEFSKNKAKALLVLTDGYFRHDVKQDPKKPVIWLIYDNPNFKPEFGTAIHFSKD